jgi:WH1 domain
VYFRATVPPFTMPSILSDEDKETVKRFVPRQTNKIQAVAVARLYVAYPNKSKWTYTGLQGAIVLANDLVGNTYWLKMVDVSVCRPEQAGQTLSSPVYLLVVAIE